MEGDAFHFQQALHDLDGLAHRLQRLFAFNAHIFRQRIPPGAEATYNAIRRKIVQRQKSRGE